MNNKITRKKPKVDHIEIARQNIDAQFDGFRILHVSDLHNKEFGLNQSILIETTQEIKPDIIAFTGDIYFGGRAEKSLLYLEEAAKAAPVYFVTGNHEYNYNDYIKERLIEIGVNVLDNRAEEINKDGACLSLIGVDDFLFFRDKNKFSGTIKTLAQNSQGFKILLSHKPHFVDIYENSGADLVLSGHAHGGQIRLPF
ncbi:MAG TPA: metallophosphoesterase, partial [Clostridia bacterium]